MYINSRSPPYFEYHPSFTISTGFVPRQMMDGFFIFHWPIFYLLGIFKEKWLVPSRRTLRARRSNQVQISQLPLFSIPRKCPRSNVVPLQPEYILSAQLLWITFLGCFADPPLSRAQIFEKCHFTSAHYSDKCRPDAPHERCHRTLMWTISLCIRASLSFFPCPSSSIHDLRLST